MIAACRNVDLTTVMLSGARHKVGGEMIFFDSFYLKSKKTGLSDGP